MRIRSSIVAVLSSVVLFACGGANQEAKSANEKDPWADYKGTYATAAGPKAEGASKSKPEAAKTDSKAKVEKTEDVKPEEAPKKSASSSASPSKAKIGGESVSSVTSESVGDAVKTATKGKLSSSVIVIGPQYEQINVKTKAGVAVSVFRKASSPDENGPAIASPKSKNGEVSKNDAAYYDEDADVLVVVTGGKKAGTSKILGSILKK